MKRLISIFLLFILSLTCLKAGNSRTEFTYGIEWGYKASILTGGHMNFFAPDGYRVDIDKNALNFYANSHAAIHMGMDIKDLWNLSACFGYAGIADYHHSIPITIRLTRFLKQMQKETDGYPLLMPGLVFQLRKPLKKYFQAKLVPDIASH